MICFAIILGVAVVSFVAGMLFADYLLNKMVVKEKGADECTGHVTGLGCS